MLTLLCKPCHIDISILLHLRMSNRNKLTHICKRKKDKNVSITL